MSKINKVFLGGTCNGSTWREKLIKKLDVSYFNPVVDDWDEKAKTREIKERETAEFVLYVITPLMTGMYSIAEAVDDSNKRSKTTIFCVLNKDDNKEFDKFQKDSLKEVSSLIEKNGSKVFKSLIEIADFLNKSHSKNEMKTLAGL